MTKRMYIAGKVTGQNRIDCLIKFQAAENRVRNMGYEPINPIKIVPEATIWPLAMKICMKSLLTCDAILVLPDYLDSPGAMLEVQVAKAIAMEIFT